MMTYNVTVTKDLSKQIRAGLLKLEKTEVVVGYPAGTDEERKDVTNVVNGHPITTPGGDISNAALAYIQDKGSPANNIPARPFLDEGVESAAVPIEKQLARAATAALEGKPEEVDKGLQGAGIEGVSGVRNYLTQGVFWKLAKRTLASRKARGFVGTKPLIVTGQLRAAVNYAVRGRTG